MYLADFAPQESNRVLPRFCGHFHLAPKWANGVSMSKRRSYSTEYNREAYAWKRGRTQAPVSHTTSDPPPKSAAHEERLWRRQCRVY